ncbi:MAG: hypothetical protein Q8O55_03685 [Dehalococcoidales bacterium]|nr:hypothetical protein [Dehalococcoidales bacterium]
MNTGRLYKYGEEQPLTSVSYRLLTDTPGDMQGELVPLEYGHLVDDGNYIFELMNNDRIKCRLEKNVNRPVSGFPSRFVYRFSGS